MSTVDRAYSEKRDFIRMHLEAPVTLRFGGVGGGHHHPLDAGLIGDGTDARLWMPGALQDGREDYLAGLRAAARAARDHRLRRVRRWRDR